MLTTIPTSKKYIKMVCLSIAHERGQSTKKGFRKTQEERDEGEDPEPDG